MLRFFCVIFVATHYRMANILNSNNNIVNNMRSGLLDYVVP